MTELHFQKQDSKNQINVQIVTYVNIEENHYWFVYLTNCFHDFNYRFNEGFAK